MMVQSKSHFRFLFFQQKTKKFLEFYSIYTRRCDKFIGFLTIFSYFYSAIKVEVNYRQVNQNNESKNSTGSLSVEKLGL